MMVAVVVILDHNDLAPVTVFAFINTIQYKITNENDFLSLTSILESIGSSNVNII